AQRAFTEVPLVLERGRWVLDEDGLRRKAGMLLLCNPHNPGGTVFRAADLEPGLRHVPIASLSPEISQRTVTLMSPNKAFNFPAAGCAWAIIEDAALRRTFSEE